MNAVRTPRFRRSVATRIVLGFTESYANLPVSVTIASLFKWCQFCFELNTFIVVELDVGTYEEARLLIGADFGAVDTLGFKNREKIFG